MAYISLYRKWRSQDFDEIIGQNHITQTLKNAIESDRISHAYLFCGPRGTGKTSVARIFAKALNCEKGPTKNPCCKCQNCQKIKNGHSVDVIEIDAASNRGIDEIRDLREKVRYAPVEGKYKVYIIDEVHMLTQEAFNALLKTLEEPPSHVVFILATTEIQKVPVTIESRCQRLDFKRIPSAEIKAHLQAIAREEKINIDDKALELVVRAGEGSMRDSVSLLDQLCSYAGNTITSDNVVELLGSSDDEMLFSISNALLNKDISKAIASIKEGIEQGKSVHQLVRDLLMHFRNLLFIKANAQEALEVSTEHLKGLEKQAGVFQPVELIKIINTLFSAELDMKWHPHARLVLEVALMGLMEDAKKDSLSFPPLSKGEMSKLCSDKGGKVLATVNPDPQMGAIKDKWNEILEKVKKVSLYGYVSLHEGEPCEFNAGKKLVISFRKGYAFHKERLEEQKNKEAAENVISQVMGRPVKIECRILDEAKNAKAQITIDAVKEIFEGEVV